MNEFLDIINKFKVLNEINFMSYQKIIYYEQIPRIKSISSTLILEVKWDLDYYNELIGILEQNQKKHSSSVKVTDLSYTKNNSK